MFVSFYDKNNFSEINILLCNEDIATTKNLIIPDLIISIFYTSKLIKVYPYVKEPRLLKLVFVIVFLNRYARLEQTENIISRLGTFGHKKERKGSLGNLSRNIKLRGQANHCLHKKVFVLAESSFTYRPVSALTAI